MAGRCLRSIPSGVERMDKQPTAKIQTNQKGKTPMEITLNKHNCVKALRFAHKQRDDDMACVMVKGYGSESYGEDDGLFTGVYLADYDGDSDADICDTLMNYEACQIWLDDATVEKYNKFMSA
jgi:hypothetical protein